MHEWLLSNPLFHCAPVALTTSRGTAPYDMPAVQREHFAVVLKLETCLALRMFSDLPHRLQPYANPSAADVVAYARTNAGLAARQPILNEIGSKAYCGCLLNTVAFIAEELGFDPPPMPLPEDYYELVNVRMDNSLQIGTESVVAFEVKTDLVFNVHEIRIHQPVDVPWLGVRDISMRHCEGALPIVIVGNRYFLELCVACSSGGSG